MSNPQEQSPTQGYKAYKEQGTGIHSHVFTCSNCGDVWNVSEVDATGEGDVFDACDSCGREVKQKFIDGVPVMHDWTQSELDAIQPSEENEN